MGRPKGKRTWFDAAEGRFGFCGQPGPGDRMSHAAVKTVSDCSRLGECFHVEWALGPRAMSGPAWFYRERVWTDRLLVIDSSPYNRSDADASWDVRELLGAAGGKRMR
jgi:hypothetical protein